MTSQGQNNHTTPANRKWRGRAFSVIKRLTRRFHDDTSGNVFLMFGLAAIPLFVASGMAVDMARQSWHQQRLVTALDAATLAVANMEGATETEMLAMARSNINVNYGSRPDLNGNEIDLILEITDRTVKLTADVDMPTTITTLTGVHKMDVHAVSEVTRQIFGTEIALVLDNTGSMSGSKIEGLRDAAKTLLDVMFEDASSSNQIKIAVVPFSAAVNVGTDNEAADWLDTDGNSSVSKLNFNDPTWHNMRAWQELSNRSWNGCVEARATPNDILDIEPNTGNPETLFAPYFAPDEPDNDDSGVDDNYNYTYKNDYIDDGLGEANPDLDLRQQRGQKYVGASVSSSSNGPNFNCDISPITPLTNVEFDLREAIDNMVATGYTNITQGIAWGWHVLSPTAPFEEGAEYTDKEWKKYIIVMTDGDNNWGNYSSHNETRYTGYGFVAQGRLGVTDNSDAKAALDDRTRDVCTNAKDARTVPDEKIIIYSITFGDLSTLR